MKSSGLKISSIAAAVALLSTVFVPFSLSAASAADMLEEQGEEYTEVEFGTGWYIRGDIGGGLFEVEADTNFGTGSSNLGTPLTVSVAAGRTFSEGFRLEAQLNQFNNLGFSSSTNYANCGTEVVGISTLAVTGDCSFSSNAEVNASSLMANAYMDLGKFGGFTPYIGAGFGAAYVSWNDFSWEDRCVGVQVTDCGAGGGVGTTVRASGNYTGDSSFTYAVNAMLGTSYDISRELKLDIGYRYTYIGEAGVARAADNAGLANDWTIGSTDVHEVRVGFRYEIW